LRQYILSLDAGTTSNRAILFDHAGRICQIARREFEQKFPKPGWVEHDPEEIWSTQKFVARDALARQGITAREIAAIGITNQRETTLVWDRETGKPVYNAIVWQDRRTAGFCDQLKSQGVEETVRQKTGLLLDPYFSGTKIRWILDNVPSARKQAEKGRLAFGTVDTWLVWRLTHGRKHITDVSNASRTLLFNIHNLSWDRELLQIFGIPDNMLPRICSSSENYADTVKEHFGEQIPVSGIAGDQQAALFGQMCIEKGMVKNTYGTGCFVMMNTGARVIDSMHNLLSTVAWQIGKSPTYALEGSIFIGGAAIQWLRDKLQIIKNAKEVEQLARSVSDNGGVYFVPAFVGLGAPHWDPYATGTIIGITRNTSGAHIARAALEAIALQSMDVINTMAKDSGTEIMEVKVDGGAAENDLLMQIQANAIRKNVIRPMVTETTALGAAYFAGLAVGFWENIDGIKKQWQVDRIFEPGKDAESFQTVIKGWERALERSKGWNRQD